MLGSHRASELSRITGVSPVFSAQEHGRDARDTNAFSNSLRTGSSVVVRRAGPANTFFPKTAGDAAIQHMILNRFLIACLCFLAVAGSSAAAPPPQRIEVYPDKLTL